MKKISTSKNEYSKLSIKYLDSFELDERNYLVLELGGKNPVIVDKKCNLKVTAKRIAWAKLANTGQICVCADHVFVPKELKQQLCEEIKKNWIKFFGENQKDKSLT